MKQFKARLNGWLGCGLVLVSALAVLYVFWRWPVSILVALAIVLIWSVAGDNS